MGFLLGVGPWSCAKWAQIRRFCRFSYLPSNCLFWLLYLTPFKADCLGQNQRVALLCENKCWFCDVISQIYCSGAYGLFWRRRKLLVVWSLCWRDANAEGQTNITVDAPALKEAEECLQWAAGMSPGLSTYFFEYSNRSLALRDRESQYGCCRPGRKQYRKGRSTWDSFSTKEKALGIHWSYIEDTVWTWQEELALCPAIMVDS